MPKLAKKGEWSDNKRAVAEAMAEGIETQGQIAKRFNIQDSTISRWKRDPVFLKKIDEITLTLERHTLAGMLRRIDDQQKYTTVNEKEWLKIEEFRAKLLGFDRQKVDVKVEPITVTNIDIDEKLAEEFGNWLATKKEEEAK